MRCPSLGLGGIGRHVRVVATCFPFFLKGEYNKGSWLIYCLIYYLGLYAGSYRFLLFMYSFGATFNFMWVLFLWSGCVCRARLGWY